MEPGRHWRFNHLIEVVVTFVFLMLVRFVKSIFDMSTDSIEISECKKCFTVCSPDAVQESCSNLCKPFCYTINADTMIDMTDSFSSYTLEEYTNKCGKTTNGSVQRLQDKTVEIIESSTNNSLVFELLKCILVLLWPFEDLTIWDIPKKYYCKRKVRGTNIKKIKEFSMTGNGSTYKMQTIQQNHQKNLNIENSIITTEKNGTELMKYRIAQSKDICLKSKPIKTSSRNEKENHTVVPTSYSENIMMIRDLTWGAHPLPVPNIQIDVNILFEPLITILDEFPTEDPGPEITMRYELLRVYTLRNYPKENKPYIIRLAGAGFYYAAEGDEVVCYTCGMRHHDWVETDVPMEIHKRFAPNCKFLTKNDEVNVPVPRAAGLEVNKFAFLDEPSSTNVTTAQYNSNRPSEDVSSDVTSSLAEHMGLAPQRQRRPGNFVRDNGQSQVVTANTIMTTVESNIPVLRAACPEVNILAFLDEPCSDNVSTAQYNSNRPYEDVSSDVTSSLAEHIRLAPQRQRRPGNFVRDNDQSQVVTANTIMTIVEGNVPVPRAADPEVNKFAFLDEFVNINVTTAHHNSNRPSEDVSSDVTSSLVEHMGLAPQRQRRQGHFITDIVQPKEVTANTSMINVEGNVPEQRAASPEVKELAFSDEHLNDNVTKARQSSYHLSKNVNNDDVFTQTEHKPTLHQRKKLKIGESQDLEDVNRVQPKHPDYANKSRRISSFQGWPDNQPQTPEILADAGFYFAGHGNTVRCFFCDICLSNWAEEDSPWIEHARMSRDCVYLKQLKGEEFINLVYMAVQYTQKSKETENERYKGNFKSDNNILDEYVQLGKGPMDIDWETPSAMNLQYEGLRDTYACDQPPQCGLVNRPGDNVCFVNAVLQCLRVTDICNVLKEHQQCRDSIECFVCILNTFFTCGPKSSINICARLQGVWPEYKFGTQQDAHEFVQKIMEQIKETCFRDGVNTNMDVFFGKQLNFLTCSKCKKTSSTTEIFHTLSLSIQNIHTVEEALVNFIAQEEIDSYQCGRCNQRGYVARTTSLLTAPKNLILHLKRFVNSGHKDCRSLQIENTIKLGKFLTEQNGPEVASSLIAAIIHTGASLTSGHYYCYTHFGLNWYRMDDTEVKEVDESNLEEITGTSYLLFYRTS